MTDVHTPEVRSFNMSKIRSKNTSPEIKVRKYLHKRGFRFRLHVKSLPGTPDIVLPKFKTVIFVQGCFWHGHEGCRYFVIPKSRTEWWLNKITKNQLNDRRKIDALIKMGWSVVEIWECALKSKQLISTLDDTITRILSNRNV